MRRSFGAVLCLVAAACGTPSARHLHSVLPVAQCVPKPCGEYPGWKEQGDHCVPAGKTTLLRGETRELTGDSIVPQVTLRFLDNDSAEPLPLCAKSDDNGLFEIPEMPLGLTVAVVTSADGYVSVYHFNMNYSAPATAMASWLEQYYILSAINYRMAGGYAFAPVKGKSILAGKVFRNSDPQLFGGGTVAARGEDLPTYYVGMMHIPVRGGTLSDATGDFLIPQANPGRHTLDVSYGGKTVGSARVLSFPDTVSFTYITAVVVK